jgi:hypothetical protein
MWLVGIGGESEDLKTARPGFVHLRTCDSSYFITLRFAICIGFRALFAKTSPADADSSQPWSSICPGKVAPAACVSTIAAGREKMAVISSTIRGRLRLKLQQATGGALCSITSGGQRRNPLRARRCQRRGRQQG